MILSFWTDWSGQTVDPDQTVPRGGPNRVYTVCHSIFLTQYCMVQPLYLDLNHDMTNPTNECVPSEDSDQPVHLSSLIRVFAVRMKKAWILSYPLSAQQWSDWADAQVDQSLCWVHIHFVGFVMSWLIYCCTFVGVWKLWIFMVRFGLVPWVGCEFWLWLLLGHLCL